jgi:hypothetical protein
MAATPSKAVTLLQNLGQLYLTVLAGFVRGYPPPPAQISSDADAQAAMTSLPLPYADAITVLKVSSIRDLNDYLQISRPVD